MNDEYNSMHKLMQAVDNLTRSVVGFRRALVRLTKPYSKQRLPRKLKKRIQKEAERAVFELQFEVFN